MWVWRRLLDGATELSAQLATLAIAMMALLYTAEIIARYFFNAPLNLSGDLSSYLLCVCAMLALPRITRDGGHIAVTFIMEQFDAERQRVYAKVLAYVTGIACVATMIFIADEAWEQFQSGTITSQANPIPKWWLSALAAYAFGLTALHLFFSEIGPRTDDDASEGQMI